MGQTLRGATQHGGRRGPAAALTLAVRRARRALAPALVALPLLGGGAPAAAAQSPARLPPGAQRFDAGRFTAIAYPRDAKLARSLLDAAQARDTFPGLPRPSAAVVIAVAPDRDAFQQLTGGLAPEWGAAVAFPRDNRIVMQGSRAGSDAGDPIRVLRHELAHLALHEVLGDLAPRWFDEGYASYAASEVERDDYLAANLTLALRGMPTLAALDSGFYEGRTSADASYALAERAVAELAALDPQRGLSLFIRYWHSGASFDAAVREAYGVTGAEYERRWRQNTRRRFGALALLSDITLGTVLMLALLGPLWWQRRTRDRERLTELRARDAAADRAAAEDALAQLLGVAPAPVGAEGDGKPAGEGAVSE